MSFSRPDPASPAQVADATFPTGRRGFDQNEVRDFLRMVSSELSRLHERERFLERELQTAQEQADPASVRLDDETLTRMLGEETARVLNAARESSQEIRAKAEQAAAQMLMEAGDEATRLREEAEIEASRRRADAANDAEAELSMAKQQGREMVNEARSYRERVLSELARRRELAREQIEQLIHGRDRLMQAFERARLVAVDVVSEMQPLGEPDEYVNLQPSTGPVPVMIARDAMPDRAANSPDGVFDRDAEDDDPVADADASQAMIDDDDGDDGITTDAADAADGDLTIDDTVTGDTTTGIEDDESASDLDPDADAGDDPVSETAIDVEAARVVDPDDGSVDDVVVDLFARLRATSDEESARAVDASPDAADPDAHDLGDDAGSTDADTTDGPATDEPITDELPSHETVADEALIGDALTGDALTDGTSTDGTSTDDAVADEAGADDRSTETAPFEQRDSDLTPLIVAAARKLKRVLADEQNEVLEALRRNEPVRNLDALLPWSSHHSERYWSVIGDDLLLAANAGAALTDEGRVPKLRKAAGQQAVQQAAETITRSLVGPLRDRLERSVADGDGDNPAIAQKARAVYREWKTKHIDEQLDDVFRAAHGRGTLAAFDLDTPVEWVPDPRHDACPDCDDNRLAGVVAAGQEFPTGHLCTPAHPGCRCLLLRGGR